MAERGAKAAAAAEKDAKAADAQLKALLAQPANQVCADCGASKPRFASITLAVFLCNRCYGIHRGVGAHITRTKCIGLDRWSLQDVHRMRCIGNAVASAYWEQNVPQGHQRPALDSPDAVVEKWIRDKYERKLFCPPDVPPPAVPPAEEGSLSKLPTDAKLSKPPTDAKLSKPSVSTSGPPLRIPGPQDPTWKPFG